MLRNRVIGLTLALVTLLLYGRVLFHDFISYDDFDYVTANRVVQRGLTWEGVAWAFTTRHTGNWHPVTWLSHMLDCQLYGSWAGGHHLTNVLLHLANTLLLFALLRRLTGAVWPGAAVAALFAWHPLHVESVAWVAERKDVLSTLFGLLTVMAYLRHVKEADRRAYIWALVCFAVGLLAKPMLVTLPLLLLLLDFWPLNRLGETRPDWRARFWPLLREKLPFFALAGASSAVTIFAQQQSGAMATLASLPLATRLGNALLACVAYLEKLLWPQGLAVIYPLDIDWPAWRVALAGGALVLLTVVALASTRRRPWLAMGWLWFGLTLLPVIGLVQVGAQFVADRYTYVPAIGLFIAVAWLGRELSVGPAWRRQAVTLAAGAVLAACLAGSWMQLTHWQNSITLFEHAVAVTRDNFIAQNHLGYALMNAGRFAGARPWFEQVLRDRPDYFLARHNLAVCLAEQGQVESALAQCDQLIATNPDYVAAHHLRGDYLQRLGRHDEALVSYQRALALAPGYRPTRLALGARLSAQGNYRDAATHYRAALRGQDDAELRYRLANCLLQSGQTSEAIAQYRAALRLNAALVEARNNLASALTQRGDWEGALVQLQAAVRARPDYPEARFNLAALFARLGKWNEAARQYRELLQRQPDHAQARFELALALLNQGNTSEAIPHLREFLRRHPGSPAGLNALARALATAAEANLRSGGEAVRLAEEVCAISRHTNCFHLDTLALAYAAAGRIEEAIRAGEQAVALATAGGKTNAAAEFAKHLAELRSQPPNSSR